MVRLRSSTRYTGACFVVGEAKLPYDGRDFVEVAGDVTIVIVLRECMMGGEDSAIGVEIGKLIRVADEWIASGWRCGHLWWDEIPSWMTAGVHNPSCQSSREQRSL